MGAYINPPNGVTKEAWLLRNGYTAHEKLKWEDVSTDKHLPVILVDNGFFTAAAIAFSEREFRAFTDITDARPRTMWIVPKKLLYDVSNLEDYLPRKKK